MSVVLLLALELWQCITDVVPKVYHGIHSVSSLRSSLSRQLHYAYYVVHRLKPTLPLAP